MTERILVAYASRRGSTREVAESIAVTLGALEADVETRPAHDVHSLEGYDGVVLGGGLYAGRLHKDARRFLHRHREALAEVPLAVFAMGPDELTEEKVAQSRAQLDRALAHEPAIAPATVAIFGGVVDPTTFRFPLNRMPASDARDWHAIDAWAEELPRAFAAARVPSPK
jgi:menaquinone-dependent protoporphyrinogen oxidase